MRKNRESGFVYRPAQRIDLFFTLGGRGQNVSDTVETLVNEERVDLVWSTVRNAPRTIADLYEAEQFLHTVKEVTIHEGLTKVVSVVFSLTGFTAGGARSFQGSWGGLE